MNTTEESTYKQPDADEMGPVSASNLPQSVLDWARKHPEHVRLDDAPVFVEDETVVVSLEMLAYALLRGLTLQDLVEADNPRWMAREGRFELGGRERVKVLREKLRPTLSA